MNNIKSLLFKLLCNNISGSIIYKVFGDKIPDIRWKNFSYSVTQGSVNRTMIAAVFWGFYESAEIRFIEKHMSSALDVMELGGSIGVVSSHIASKLNPVKKLVVVEANPHLVNTIQENINRHRKDGVIVEVVNAAVGYGYEKLRISVTDNNTETRVVAGDSSGKMIEVEAVTLNALYRKNQINDFTLVCDIEGSEVEVFLNEPECLQYCKAMILELHDTSYKGQPYSISDIQTLIQTRHGFTLVEQHGPVFYYQK